MLLTACQTIDSNLPKNPEKSVQTRVQIAAEYIRSGDLDAAKRTLDQALRIDSRDATANMMMGILLQSEGSQINLDKADRYFRTAISSEPENAQIRLNYGSYLYHIKRYTAAIEQLKIAGASLGYEQRYIALENLGQVYLAVNQRDQAEQAFIQALQVTRGNSEISLLELSEIFYLKQQMNDSAKAYDQYIRLVGKDRQGARALWIGARIARAHGDKRGMQVLINQMRALYPDSPEYQRYLQLKNNSEVVWK